jgi:hypothetical protein
MQGYYQLNFVRKPEFMGFNGYDDAVKRSSFNPLAWGDQNRARLEQWRQLSGEAEAVEKRLPGEYREAYFELVGYPVEAAAAHNEKILKTDRGSLDASRGESENARGDELRAQAAYERVQALTARYNALGNGKWEGMMDAAPHAREVFKRPEPVRLPVALPAAWKAFEGKPEPVAAGPAGAFVEREATVSINAAHFQRKQDGGARWRVLADLGISGASVEYGAPGAQASAEGGEAPWLEYDFETVSHGEAVLTLALLPSFPVDSEHRLRYGVAVDGGALVALDAGGAGEWQEKTPPTWAANVLRNFAVARLPLGALRPGHHTLRLIYRDPGVVFEHLTVSFAGAAPAYPAPPETRLNPALKE